MISRALILVGWVVLIVIGAGEQAAASTWLGVDHLEIVSLVLLAAMALVGLVLLIVLRPFNAEWTEPPKRRKRSIGVVLLIMLLLVWRPDLLDGLADEMATEEEAAVVVGAPAEAEEPETEVEPVAQATDILIVVAIGAAIVVVWLVSRHVLHGQAEVEPVADDPAASPEELLAALDLARGELAAGDDPRSAILAAYAVLEDVVAAQGRPRRRAETPAEHMRRVTGDLAIDSEPLVRLGRLYEIARFSELDLSSTDRDQARRDLERVRADLLTDA